MKAFEMSQSSQREEENLLVTVTLTVSQAKRDFILQKTFAKQIVERCCF